MTAVRVANLWPEFPARDVYRTVADGTECKNPSKSVVAATFEKAKTYVFAEPLVWDREVGGSNPLAPTNHINNLRLPTLAAVSLVWEICDWFALRYRAGSNPGLFEASKTIRRLAKPAGIVPVSRL